MRSVAASAIWKNRQVQVGPPRGLKRISVQVAHAAIRRCAVSVEGTGELQRIFVGDIQGCADEFDELLDRARVDFGESFEIWAVGDLINRGPDNLRVLSRMRELVEAGRGRVVLGNHELGLLLVHAGLAQLKRRDTYFDVLNSRSREAWIEWLRRLPLAATGVLPVGSDTAGPSAVSTQPFAMVHASVHPEWDLAELERRARSAEERLADPDALGWRSFLGAREGSEFETLERLVSCRSVMKTDIPKDGKSWSSNPPKHGEGKEFIPWHRAWSARHHHYGIVYGHWAQQGLHVGENLRGLDTGCVHHGRGREGSLTAWLPDPNAPLPFAAPVDGLDDRLWHIPARRAYYAEKLSKDG